MSLLKNKTKKKKTPEKTITLVSWSSSLLTAGLADWFLEGIWPIL